MSQLQHFGRGAVRVVKNYTKGYSDTQTKVRDATSNDPWGPSGTQMNEIAQLTYNQGDFVEIMEMLDKRLNDKGKNWRHVFKALTVLDYCLHAGSENVVIYFKDNLYIVKTLKEFVYVDDQGKDVGHNVRQKAKDITNLLQDEDRLRTERRQRGAMRDRMLGTIADSGLQGEDDDGARDRRGQRPNGNSRPTNNGSSRRGDEDEDLQRALAESMETNQDEERRRSQRIKEEDELQRAIRLSEEEDARKKREQEEANQRALMDDNFQLESNNQYSQQQQQQPMNTGFPLVDMNNWQQPLQPQYTSFNPFHAQMLAQQQQEDAMRQQQQQQMMQQQYMQQQQQQQMLEQQRQQEEFMRQQQSLIPQHTAVGSNNPFAPKQQQHSLLGPIPGEQDQLQQQPTSTFASSFLPIPTSTNNNTNTSQSPSPITKPASPPKPSWQPPAKKDDGTHAGLANLIGRGREDGLDTFGNIGNLRIPTGAAFHQSNRMAVQQTGAQNTNPFFKQPEQQQQQTNEQPFFQI